MDAEVTVAFTDPKYTVLSDRLELNPEPLMLTVEPTFPLKGETDVIYR
jgi:hypothetical protein